MSRKITSVAIATVVAVSFLFVGASAVAAHDGGTAVGVSGNCDDADGNGGGGSVGVGGDDGVDATSPSEIQSTIEGLTFYGEQNQKHDREDTCDGSSQQNDTSDAEEGDNDYDYLEVHAQAEGEGAQYCFSEDNANDNGQVTTDGSDACHS